MKQKTLYDCWQLITKLEDRVSQKSKWEQKRTKYNKRLGYAAREKENKKTKTQHKGRRWKLRTKNKK